MADFSLQRYSELDKSTSAVAPGAKISALIIPDADHPHVNK